jgi:hypothetical protein
MCVFLALCFQISRSKCDFTHTHTAVRGTQARSNRHSSSSSGGGSSSSGSGSGGHASSGGDAYLHLAPRNHLFSFLPHSLSSADQSATIFHNILPHVIQRIRGPHIAGASSSGAGSDGRSDASTGEVAFALAPDRFHDFLSEIFDEVLEEDAREDEEDMDEL